MSAYKRVLLVVDLSDRSEHIGRRARAVAEANGAELELLHVLEYVPIEPMGESLLPVVEIEDELIERARRKLSALAVKLGLTDSPCYVAAGNIKSEILRAAPCDVLAIRVRD